MLRAMDSQINTPKPKELIGLTFIHLAVVLICQILAIFLSQFLMISSLVNEMLPVDFNNYNQEEKTEIYKVEIEKIGEQMKKNPEELISQFYTLATKTSPWILFYERLIWAFAFLVPAYFLLHKFLDAPLPDLKLGIGANDIMRGVLGGLVIFLIANLIFFVLGLLGHKPEMNVANKALLNGVKGNIVGFLWGIYSIALVTALIEETFFRGFLLQQFDRMGSARYGLYFTSLLFGFLHHSGEASVSIAITLSLVGMGFGALFLLTKNIWVPILAHATYNSLVLILAFIFGDMSS